MPAPDRLDHLISVSCPRCGFRFRVERRFAGQAGICPVEACGTEYMVLEPLETPPPPVPVVTASQPSPLSTPVSTPLPSVPQRPSCAESAPAAAAAATPARRGLRWLGLSLAGTVAAVVLALFAFAVRNGSPPAGPGQVLAAATENLPAAKPKPKPDRFPKQIAPFLKKYCLECHGPETDNAGLRFDKYRSTSDLLADRKTWNKALQYLELGAMPPPDFDRQPDGKERREVVAFLESALFDIDCEMVRDPGRVTIRRLNRAEYDNTIRDLLGVDFQPARNFPSDDVGAGFDNIGDVLSVSPLLVEKYLDAAEQIAEKAIVLVNPFESRNQKLTGKKFNQNGGSLKAGAAGSFAFYSQGYVGAAVEFPADGEYVLRVNASADQAGPDPARLALSLDGKLLVTFDIKSKNRGDRRNLDHRLDVRRGRHPLRVAFINDYYKPKATDLKLRGDRNAYVFSVEVVGPLNVKPEDLPASHRRLLKTVPGSDGKPPTALVAARQNLAPFMERALRRPVPAEEVTPIAEFVAAAVAGGESFVEAMRLGVQAVLVSPQFLFRFEHDPSPDDPTDHHSITDFELATRLSYFLWSSMPDEELFRLAREDRLHRLDVLETQVRRMLKDPRSRALVDNFASQWLNLRILDEITPDPKRFPEFNDKLRESMKQETRLFFTAVMREDRSVLDFLDGRFTHVNEALAKLYGIPGISGEEFRRIDLPGKQRAGVLTQASILTLTSNPDRTSPVKRGKWIMVNILDSPPPPPPPDVPELEVAVKAAPDASLRKQLELHRTQRTCAICHRQMDALGFGFEHYDAIGRWREKDGKHAIDAKGTLPSQESFSGAIELIEILKKRRDRFCRSLSRKMLVYSLGRGLEFYDRCAIDKIKQACRKADYRFSALVIAIAQSEPFRMRRGEKVKE